MGPGCFDAPSLFLSLSLLLEPFPRLDALLYPYGVLMACARAGWDERILANASDACACRGVHALKGHGMKMLRSSTLDLHSFLGSGRTLNAMILRTKCSDGRCKWP